MHVGVRALAVLLPVFIATVVSAKPAVFETRYYRFQCDPESGRYEVRDQQTGQVWHSNPYRNRFGEAALWVGGKLQHFDLARCEAVNGATGMDLTFRPVGEQPGGWLRVRLRSGQAGKALECSYEAEGLSVECVRLLDDALWVTESEQATWWCPCAKAC